ncbi:thioredoxin domain protein [Leptospira fainei serovar Hurstbridge str. BUT 6]|uniref:Thioredoxin domain protein n=1 Tax=Leptospira fainei serovar Hurstbridge str. BUT 6 TaxID=1193011 RepID=S3W8E6_9LEPT|nr:thioredoxin family protein [Leptospira fainei]EPG76317.1 thioredoxin domain protein [Leptospira fainei serovar Hurstbridge str. BUT 6]
MNLRNPFLILLFSVIFSVVSTDIAAVGVQWESSVEKAFAKAKQEGKPIFIDVYADWCGYCKTLKKEIYPKKEVQAELSRFVLLSLDGDRFPNLKKKYQVSGYPTLLFLDRNGSITEKISGMPDAKMVVKTLRKAYSKRDQEGDLLASLEKNPGDSKLLLKVGEYYFEAREYAKAANYFYKAFSSDEKRTTENQHRALFNLGVTYSEMQNYEKTVKTFTLYLEKYPPGTGYAQAAFYYRGIAFKELGKKEEAKSDLTKALELSSDPTEKKELEGILRTL